jgi:hypothetical protein
VVAKKASIINKFFFLIFHLPKIAQKEVSYDFAWGPKKPKE